MLRQLIILSLHMYVFIDNCTIQRGKPILYNPIQAFQGDNYYFYYYYQPCIRKKKIAISDQLMVYVKLCKSSPDSILDTL